ncbi:hypothetical protein EVAR_19447_1 [Eumeta japonica]|uniref:Uncharacterized protein n=1 Tax=Eumeta variegata TaxID=151549 RepID=A0A4C1TRT5_EUMVA|nr:hypothetical protein EVAR_19447_1 [Eumeta japonica]
MRSASDRILSLAARGPNGWNLKPPTRAQCDSADDRCHQCDGNVRRRKFSPRHGACDYNLYQLIPIARTRLIMPNVNAQTTNDIEESSLKKLTKSDPSLPGRGFARVDIKYVPSSFASFAVAVTLIAPPLLILIPGTVSDFDTTPTTPGRMEILADLPQCPRTPCASDNKSVRPAGPPTRDRGVSLDGSPTSVTQQFAIRCVMAARGNLDSSVPTPIALSSSAIGEFFEDPQDKKFYAIEARFSLNTEKYLEPTIIQSRR